MPFANDKNNLVSKLINNWHNETSAVSECIDAERIGKRSASLLRRASGARSAVHCVHSNGRGGVSHNVASHSVRCGSLLCLKHFLFSSVFYIIVIFTNVALYLILVIILFVNC